MYVCVCEEWKFRQKIPFIMQANARKFSKRVCFQCIFDVNVCICQFEKHLRRLQVNFTPHDQFM